MFSLTKLPVPIDPFMEQRLKLRIFVHEPFSEKRFLVLVDPLENIGFFLNNTYRFIAISYLDISSSSLSQYSFF